jgi:hypothetical protein
MFGAGRAYPSTVIGPEARRRELVAADLAAINRDLVGTWSG